MSKHWQPDRRVKDRRHASWGTGQSYQRPGKRVLSRPRRWAFRASELRLMVLGGIFAGLALAGLPMLASTPAPDDGAWRQATVPDRWAESRRSRAILEAQEGSPGPNPTAGSPIRATPAAVRVIDGDTFWYGGQKIRIADIDTPEVNGRCAYESQLAARATARMAALLEAGPFELTPMDRDEDRYGRKLRVVTRGGRSLGDQLVAEGLARTWSGRREPWC